MKQPLSEREFKIRFYPKTWEKIDKIIEERPQKITDLVRSIVETALDRESSDASKELLPVTAAVIGSAICGPFDEALADTETSYNVNADLARELDLHTGDVFIRAHGDSMAGMGITDGSLVTLEILPPGRNPRNGEVALVQIERGNGDFESSLKRWTSKAGKVALLDGNDNEIPIPDDVVKMTAIGVARSYIARI